MNPKNMLVTGGAGFIGSNFINVVLKKDARVKIVNLDLLTYAGRKQNLELFQDSNRHTFIHGDICDRNLVDKILREHEIDTIVHFAAESHVDRSIAGPEVFLRTNILGTFTLLEAARVYWIEQEKWTARQCRFHHVSTDEVYGSLALDEAAFTETSCYQPNSPYSASKASSDHWVRAYFHTYQLPVTISNCSNNYGPHQDEEKLIPKVIRACLDSKPIPVYGNGSNIRDWLYVDDHCEAIWTILMKGQVGEVYNVGANNEHNNLDIVYGLCDLIQKYQPKKQMYRDLIKFIPDRPGHDFRYAIDNRKICSTLSWETRINFLEGLNKTVQWYLKDRSKNLEEK